MHDSLHQLCTLMHAHTGKGDRNPQSTSWVWRYLCIGPFQIVQNSLSYCVAHRKVRGHKIGQPARPVILNLHVVRVHESVKRAHRQRGESGRGVA